MMCLVRTVACSVLLLFFFVKTSEAATATISGELKKWHKVTLLFDGVNTTELDGTNPFLNYRLIVTFTNGGTTHIVHGHFAADGNAAESSANSGDKWRAYFSPDQTGTWNYTVSFKSGTNLAINGDTTVGTAEYPLHGETGSFNIAATDKTGNDFRAQGRLDYVGEHYLQFAETGKYFIKGGADSPENFLGYFEFDQTTDNGGASTPGLNNGLHEYAPHVTHWSAGDPTWKGTKGKGIIGAVNYLASQGVNSVYFLTYNLDGGDGRDTWVWTSDTEKYRFDVSKLDQWEILFSQMDKLGIMLHVVTQETENDQVLDGGSLGNQRKLYYRELVSRFSHHLGVFWNLGEENDNSDQERVDFAQYIRGVDTYNHPIGFHNWQAEVYTVYTPILSNPSWLQYFEMVSLQAGSNYNDLASTYTTNSANASKKWIVCSDEQDPAVDPAMGNLFDLRKGPLWGNLMGGGGGVEWYFGYQGTFGDLQSEDFTVVAPLWEQTKIALDFFQNHLPFVEMEADNSFIQNLNSIGGGYGFKKDGEVYTAYLRQGGNNGNVNVTLSGTYDYSIFWYDPVTGGALQNGTVTSVTANNGVVNIGKNPGNNSDDWVVLIAKTGVVVPTPEINIKQGSNNIPSSGTYAFANTQVGSSTDVVFTIENIGAADLTVTTPLAASGDYSIVSQPASSVSAPGNTSFTVRFTPSAGGTGTGSVTITNDDANEGSYVINFSGTGIVLSPEINIKQGSNNIPSGGTQAFANTQVSFNTDVIFTIENTGTAALTLTTPLTASGDYSIFSQPASSVATAGNTSFTVRFTPTAGGTRTGLVTIVSNDSNEGSYVINFSGTGTVPPTTTTWTGNVSDDWFDDLNWTNTVSTATLDVIIPNVTPKYFPLIQGAPGTVAHTKNLTISPGARITISGLNNVELIIHGDLTNNGQLLGNGKLSFNGPSHSLNQLSFSGIVQVKPGSVLNTNGNLVLENGASLMHGVGTPGGGGTVNGQVTVKRNGHTSSNLWNYWSSPVSGANVSIIGSTPYYYSANQATGTSLPQLQQGWVNASGNMISGLGYIARGGGTVAFKGNANNADTTGTGITVNVTKNAATTVGYNFIGNPFPSGLSAIEFLKVNGPNVSPYFGNHTLTGSLYFWMDDASGGSGYNFNDFAVWSGAGVIGSINGGLLPDGNIASGQGFFVEKISNGTSTVKFSNNMRVSDNDIFFRSAPIQRLWLNVFSPTNNYNETLIAFIEDATDTFDVQYDAKKMRGNLQLALYSKMSGNDLAIQALPFLETDRVVEMGLDAGLAGNYTLNLKALDNIDETMVILLEDRLLGTYQSLRMQSEYTFNVSTPGVINNRFFLHFSAPLSINTVTESCDENDGMIELSQPGSKVWNYLLNDNGGTLIQSGQNLNGTVAIGNLDGGTYHLTLTDAYGYQVVKNILVNSVQSVHADFNYLETGNLYEVNFSSLTTGAVNYDWDLGDGTQISGLQNITHAYNLPGIYLVQLAGYNNDCDSYISKEINILPQIFTGIGQNENNLVSMFTNQGKLYLNFDFSAIEKGNVTVYDLLGKSVYHETILTTGLKEIGFRHGNENCYLVKFTSSNGSFISKILPF